MGISHCKVWLDGFHTNNIKLKKILYFACYDSPFGGSTRTTMYARKLVELGNEVTVVTSSYNHLMKFEKNLNSLYQEIDFEGFKLIEIYGFNYKSNKNNFLRLIHMFQYSFLAFFVCLMKLKKIDIVFGTSVPLFSGLMAYFLSKIKRTKFFFEIRDVWPEELIEIGAIKKNSLFAMTLRIIEKFLYRKSEKIISSLPNVNSHVDKIVPNKDILYLPNAFDGNLKFDSYSGGSKDFLRVAYLGGTGRSMKIQTLLEAFLELNSKKFSLKIIGPVEIAKDFFISKKIDIPENISLIDFIPRSEIPKYLNNADVLVHPANDSNQLKFGINSNKILEYLSSGRIVILAARVSNDPVSLSKGGYVIPPENVKEMKKTLKFVYSLSPEERKKVGIMGKKFLNQSYSINLLSEKLNSFIKKKDFN
tara:strand:- start:118 stop:1374 length:1257 start_codon:yes stop_codon:yes gene_type:complete